ncbi:TerB family tellurite resistance protein [Psychromonas sp. SP041]|uniref:tellurite resistance TerB family protein n=1 Tax=Psychromonas sp. SP041 TaxID=1365007 RepID=UPI000412E23E|nr:TerB family tellurite resistance protein [Psychromonas sp. SP041]
MITKIKQLLNTFIPEENPQFDSTLAIVCLLCEVCVADENISKEEKAVIVHSLEKLVNIEKEKASELLKVGMKEITTSTSVFDFTSQLGDLDNEARIDLIKAMWEVAYADGHLDEMEEALIRKVAALIYVNHSDFIRTKLTVNPA